MKKGTVKKKRASETVNNARWLRAVNLFIENGAVGAKEVMLKARFPRSTADKKCHLLKKHPVYLEWVNANTEKNIVNKEHLNEKLLRWADSNIVDYFDFGDYKKDGDQYRLIRIKDLTSLSREITDCIAEIQETQYGVRIKLIDKLATVAKLAEINGLIAPKKSEITGELDINHKTFERFIEVKKQAQKELSVESSNRLKDVN